MKPLMIAAAVSAAVMFSAAPSVAATGGSFARADLNGDGAVSQAEFYRTQRYEHHAFFFRLDRDNDRALSPAEFSNTRRLAARRTYRSSE